MAWPTRHGMSHTPTWNSWEAMLRRCNQPSAVNYADYGGRGIKVHPRWHEFENFLKDMGERPSGATIDRIDPDGDYEPDNCKWSTYEEQNNNKRSNVMLTYGGRTQTIAQWAREREIGITTLHRRISDYGWSVERALSTPVRSYKRASA